MPRYRLILILALCCLLLLPGIVNAQDEGGDTGGQVTHVVQPGDTLYRIAMRYGVDLDELISVNGITNRNRIYRGQVLIIPGLQVPDDSPEVDNPLVAGTPVVHVVQPGDTLTLIARQYDTTVDAIMAANNITNPNHIERGQVLTIFTAEANPEGPVEPEDAAPELVQGPPPAQTVVYIVQPGESLSHIAQRFGTSWEVLAQINNIADPNQLYAGQEIIIPAASVDGVMVEDLGIVTAPPMVGPEPTITQGRQIVVDLSDSRAYAYENGELIYSALGSTGLPATPTVQGDFTVRSKVRSQTMSGPGYYLPNVEWVLYFYQGYALHGTYWHNNFGNPMSHGCVNLTNQDAQWFYDFAQIGTPVRVQW